MVGAYGVRSSGSSLGVYDEKVIENLAVAVNLRVSDEQNCLV